MNDPQGYRLEPFDPTEMAPAELREAALLQQALEHERGGGSAHGGGGDRGAHARGDAGPVASLLRCALYERPYDPRVPHLVWQQGTPVTDAHRGHRLGLWMKAVMLKRILEERTQARFIRTGNANTNAQMLAINTQLGFRPAWSSALWQLTLADARKAVGLERAGATA